MTDDDGRHDKILQMVDAIMAVFAGSDIEECHTALSLAVTAAIVSTCTPDEHLPAANTFAAQVRKLLARPEVVQWIQAHVTIVAPGPGRAQ